ncbi:MAG: glycosyltransferase, partial [Hyphomicrobium sp.]
MISVVTISYNQAQWLPDCITSVAAQAGSWEHIVVDPGSTDGSRDIIAGKAGHFAAVVLEKDKGPADGLNKGFERATGDIFYYLNADDVIYPNAFADAVSYFEAHPEMDVVSGHGYIIDEVGRRRRSVWSDPITRSGIAHGGSILIQPATFIRRSAYERAGGFNAQNRTNWDGELVVDLYLSGARFGLVNR